MQEGLPEGPRQGAQALSSVVVRHVHRNLPANLRRLTRWRPDARPEARLLVVEDEPNIRELLATSLRFAGFEVETAGDGATALALAEAGRARPRRARRHAARRRRLRGDAAAARPRPPAADRLRDGPRRHRRQDRGPHRRRRRLRDQAVQPRGGHRPHPRRAAPHPRRRRRGVDAALPRPRAQRGLARGAPRRPGHRPVADGVQAAALPAAQPQPGPVQAADPRPRLGLRLPRRVRHRRVLHLLPAAQDRRRRAVAHPHQARRGLRSARAPGPDAS